MIASDAISRRALLVELGYDRTAYQDLPTPFGLFPNIDPATVTAEMFAPGTIDVMAPSDVRIHAPTPVAPFGTIVLSPSSVNVPVAQRNMPPL